MHSRVIYSPLRAAHHHHPHWSSPLADSRKRLILARIRSCRVGGICLLPWLSTVGRSLAVTSTHVVLAVVTVILWLLGTRSGDFSFCLSGACCWLAIILAQALQLINCLRNEGMREGGLRAQSRVSFPLNTFLKK